MEVQRRMALTPQCMSGKIYGIVSDGVHYTFLRLEGKQLLVSSQQDLISDQAFTRIINFLNEVLLSAFTSTPHCMPSKTYPATIEDLRREDETRFSLPHLSFKELLQRPPTEYIIDSNLESLSD
ncbi:hypothetical protein BDD12DRAFT_824527, partial [Trichophaea hybrida]